MVSFYLDDGCMCVRCEAIMMGRGGMEEVYEKKNKGFSEIDLN